MITLHVCAETIYEEAYNMVNFNATLQNFVIKKYLYITGHWRVVDYLLENSKDVLWKQGTNLLPLWESNSTQ